MMDSTADCAPVRAHPLRTATHALRGMPESLSRRFLISNFAGDLTLVLAAFCGSKHAHRQD